MNQYNLGFKLPIRDSTSTKIDSFVNAFIRSQKYKNMKKYT